MNKNQCKIIFLPDFRVYPSFLIFSISICLILNAGCFNPGIESPGENKEDATTEGLSIPSTLNLNETRLEGALPDTKPKSVVFENKFQILDSIVEKNISEQVIPGAVVLVSEDGRKIYEKAFGYAQLYSYGMIPLKDPVPMTVSHQFDLASLTKVFATTFGIMLLVDDKKVELDTPVSKYLPLFHGPHKDSITIRHLLTHSAGLYPWKPIYYHATTRDESYAFISDLPLAYPVGKERHYSDLGFILLGYLIEEVSGQTIHRYLRKKLYQPLDLEATNFHTERGLSIYPATSHGNPYEKRMVADDQFGYMCDEDPASFNKWREYTLIGDVNDGNSYHIHDGQSGHAGLFSSASELNQLLDLLNNNGIYKKRKILSKEVIASFLQKDKFGHGLGWAMSNDVIPVENLPEGSFGHTGFTGTFAVSIPQKKLNIIILTNRQNLGVNATGNYNSVTPLRRSITEYLLQN